MQKIIVLTLGILLIASTIYAADILIKWDPSDGATGYKIYKSTDLGLTWQAPIDVGNITSYTVTGIEENTMLLFRASAYNQHGESIRTWSGAWYDHRLKPLNTPPATGIQ